MSDEFSAYKPPAAHGDLPPPLDGGGSYAFVPIAGLGTAVVVLFGALILFDLIYVWQLAQQVQVLRAVRDGSASNAELAAMVVRVGALAGVTGLVRLALVITCCFFLPRANRNCRALGAQGMSITPGWTVGWWFIPFANLVKPYEAVKEIWQASDPAHTGDWRGSRSAPLIPAWWAAYLLSGAVGMMIAMGSILNPNADKTEQAITLAQTTMATTLGGILPAVLAIMVFRGIAQRQTARHAAAQAAAPI